MRKILLITTGGTIACPDTDENRTPNAFLNSAEKLLEKLENLLENISIESVSPFCRDSTNMSPKEWTELAVLIREQYENYDGFVITHGTDTLGYAAAALSCLVKNSRKPVVLTGSMKPFSEENSDAPDNLRNAIIFAADEKSCGVVVAFDRKIIDGRCAVKTRTDSVCAFESVNEIDFVGGETQFFDRMDERLSVIMLVPGAEPPVIPEDTRAVIVLGFGTGGLPENEKYQKLLDELVGRGVYVIMSTQVLRGGSNLSLYEVGERIINKYPVADAGKMTVEYASMKAMWALAYSDNFDGFNRLFLQ